MRYGPLFAKPIAWGDRGGVGELTWGQTKARGRLRDDSPRNLADGGASVKFGEQLSITERDKKLME